HGSCRNPVSAAAGGSRHPWSGTRRAVNRGDATPREVRRGCRLACGRRAPPHLRRAACAGGAAAAPGSPVRGSRPAAASAGGVSCRSSCPRRLPCVEQVEELAVEAFPGEGGREHLRRGAQWSRVARQQRAYLAGESLIVL